MKSFSVCVFSLCVGVSGFLLAQEPQVIVAQKENQTELVTDGALPQEKPLSASLPVAPEEWEDWADWTPEKFRQQVPEAIKLAEGRLRSLVDQKKEDRSFKSTFLAFCESASEVQLLADRLRMLMAVADSSKQRAIYAEVWGPLSSFLSGMKLNKEVYDVLKEFSLQEGRPPLTAEQKRYQELLLHEFSSTGVHLEPEKKQELLAHMEQLELKAQKFRSQVMDSGQAWSYLVTEEKELAGLSEESKKGAFERAKKQKKATDEKPAWLLTRSSAGVVLKYSQNPFLREVFWRSQDAQGRGQGKKGSWDNEGLIFEMLTHRQKVSELLGVASPADLSTRDRMVKTPQRVFEFEADLYEKAFPVFEKESAALLRFASQHEGKKLNSMAPWDWAYYGNLWQEKTYKFKEKELKEYLEMDSFVARLYELFGELFGVDVREVPVQHRPLGDKKSRELSKASVWHPDVRFYEVFDRESGAFLGAFYGDFFSRSSKRGGAWVTELFVPREKTGGKKLAFMGLNINKAPQGQKTFLSLREAQTFCHEFGHLLHALSSEVEIYPLSGTRVVRDFIEVPSQLLESWLKEEEGLDVLLRHYETREKMPKAMKRNLLRLQNDRPASALVGQLRSAYLDMELHAKTAQYLKGQYKGIDAIEEEILARKPYRSSVELPVRRPSFCRSMNHIFGYASGYAAGYYSYLWSKVIALDVFERFKKAGIFDQKVGKEWRQKVLARGNSAESEELLKDFLGRELSFAPYLKSLGLKASKKTASQAKR